MVKRSSKKREHDFAVTAFRIVQEATAQEEAQADSKLEQPKDTEGKNPNAVALGRHGTDYSLLGWTTTIVGEEIMTQQASSTTNARFKENQGKVRTWLMEEGWRVRDEHDPQVAWAISATDEQSRAIIVAQKPDKPNVILVQAAVQCDAMVLAKVRDLDQRERSEFYSDIRFALLGMNLEYAGVGDPFERIAVVNRIYHDALTNDAFIQRVVQVKNGVVLLLGKIAHLMNQEPPPLPTQTPIGFRGTET